MSTRRTLLLSNEWLHVATSWAVQHAGFILRALSPLPPCLLVTIIPIPLFPSLFTHMSPHHQWSAHDNRVLELSGVRVGQPPDRQVASLRTLGSAAAMHTHILKRLGGHEG